MSAWKRFQTYSGPCVAAAFALAVLSSCNSSDNLQSPPAANPLSGTWVLSNVSSSGHLKNRVDDGATIVITQDNNLLFGQICSGLTTIYNNDVFTGKQPKLYGFVSGSDIRLKGGTAAVTNIYEGQVTPPDNVLTFEGEYFDLVNTGTTTFSYTGDRLSPTFDLGSSDTTDYTYPYNLHTYGGTVTVTSVYPNFSGTFNFTELYEAHAPSTPASAGAYSGSFSVPFDSYDEMNRIPTGNYGTFDASGSVSGSQGDKTISVNKQAVFFAPQLNFRGTVTDNTINGSYMFLPLYWDRGWGTFKATKTGSDTVCR